MKIKTLVVFSLAVTAICTKAQNSSTSFTPVSSSHSPAPLDSGSSVTPTPFLEAISVGTLSSTPVSATLTVSASTAVTTKTDSIRPGSSIPTSILESESISISADHDISNNTTQTVHISTYNDLLHTTTSDSIQATTASFSESHSTNISRYTLSSSITINSSRTDASEYTSISLERIISSSDKSTEPLSTVVDASIPLSNDSMSENPSGMIFTKSFMPSFTATMVTSLISDYLESSTPAIPIQSSHVLTQNISSNDSSEALTSYQFDSPSISIDPSVDIATDNESILSFETASTSLRTNYFTESVYALGNISSPSSSSIVLKPSTVASESSADVMHSGIETSDIALSSETVLPSYNFVNAITSKTLSPTQSLDFSRTEISVSDSLFLDTQTKDETAFTTIELYSDISLYPSSNLDTEAVTRSLTAKSSQDLESRIRDSSSPVFSLSLTETLIPNIRTMSSYLAFSFVSEFSVSRSAPVATPTTTITTATEMVSSKEKHVTTSIPTSTGNLTLSVSAKEHKVYRIMFTFEGDCEILSGRDVLQMEFWKAFMDIIKSMTKLQSYNLDAEKMLCEPLRVYLRIEIFNETSGFNMSETFEIFKSKIASSNFFVPIIESTHVLNFTATHFEVVEIISSDMNDLEVAKTGLEVVDIVIISIASFLFAILVLMMIVLMCRECYVRKRTTTFHLPDVPHVNLKLSDFTLTRIPRPQMFYRENSRRKPAPVPVSKLRSAQNGNSDRNSNDKMEVNPDNIRVRMSKHEDGLVVGITCNNPPSPKNDSSSCSSSPTSGDQAKKCLLKGETGAVSAGVANPSYSTDDELNGNTKLVIQEDENEQLL